MRAGRHKYSLAWAILLALGLLAGCGQGRAAPAEREITDMAGRTVAVPAEVVSAFPTDPTAGICLYTLVPDRMLGWNYALNDLEKSVILEEYHDLPVFGMGDSINYEAVLAAGPSVIFVAGAIDQGSIDQADRLAEQMDIPVVMVSSDLTDTPAAYRFMGELFGVEEQAELLADYAERTLACAAALDIPEENRLRVYYGNKQDSLETAPAGSASGQIIDMVKAVNAAGAELGGGNRVAVSLEQLLAWDPDVIIVNGEPKANFSGGAAARSILETPDLAPLRAVQSGRVYGTPSAPFSWIDRPPGPNRIVGVRWLLGILYPDQCPYDVDEEVRTFFRLFYHVELTDEALAELYEGGLQREDGR